MLVRPNLGGESTATDTEALPDGIAVSVRPASSGDVQRLRRMFSRSSPSTIYRRFHSPFPRVPELALEHLVNRRERESLVAAVGNEVVGHAMYARTESEAEVAVVVEDGWQSRGIGKLLLNRLAAEARRRGVEFFTCVTLAENRRAFLLVTAVFADVGYAMEGSTYIIRAPLRSPKTRDVTEGGQTLEEGGF